MSNPDNKYIQDRFLLAQEAIDVAKLSYENGYYWSAADRAYYCMFHCAEAALALFGVEPGKTHDGVIDQFGRHIANKGLLPRKYHGQLSDAKPVRVDSTYGGPKAAGKRQAKHIVDVAERLLADVQRLAEEKRK